MFQVWWSSTPPWWYSAPVWVVFCSVLVGSSPVSSTLVGSCLICSALVGSCPVCSALLGFCPVCSALVLCPADSVSVPSLSISTWTWTSDPPPVPPLLHRLLDYIKIGSSVSRSLGGGLSRIRVMNFRPLTTRGHLLTTWTLAPRRLSRVTPDYIYHHPLH